ncbi:MAG TPA: ATP-dependent metallopeptidase FtsH/Yme1/Tma family protein, partial [Steroidobacteraceae bacterium]
MLALLIVWNAWAFMPHKSVEVPLPYSEVVSQVASGNVTAVAIVGSDITGAFAHPLTWPQPKPGKATAPGAKPQPYSRFSTTYPTDVGDATLMPLLRQHDVTINVRSPSPPWFELLLTDGLPIVLMLVVLVWMGRQASRSQSGMFGFGRNRARQYTEDRPAVTFADVAGVDEAKQDLREVVDFLSHPAKYLAIGARIPRGVLLVGPPGTGKTLLARAVAGEAGVPFFHISG